MRFALFKQVRLDDWLNAWNDQILCCGTFRAIGKIALKTAVQACDTKWIFEFPTGKYSVKGHGSLNSRGVCVTICDQFKRLMTRLRGEKIPEDLLYCCPFKKDKLQYLRCKKGYAYSKHFFYSHVALNHESDLSLE